jgi:hypothetical protein
MRLRQVLDGANRPAEGAKIALRAIPVPGEVFHVFQGATDWPVCVESLHLGRWIAISGSAFGVGRERASSLPIFLLLGLVNLRLGYWWNSGLNASDRPGSFPQSFWRRLKGQPASKCRASSFRIFSDASRGSPIVSGTSPTVGHFDNTGIYELLRRRVPFIIAVDGSEDASFDFDDMAELVRQARIDFGAEVEFVDPPTAAIELPPVDPQVVVRSSPDARFAPGNWSAQSEPRRTGPGYL